METGENGSAERKNPRAFMVRDRDH
jgi:hypothetical protein